MHALATRPSRSASLSWLHDGYRKGSSKEFLRGLRDCCLSKGNADFHMAAADLGVVGAQQRAQLLALRGLLGHGLLLHCLTMRHRVDYGISSRCAHHWLAEARTGP